MTVSVREIRGMRDRLWSGKMSHLEQEAGNMLDAIALAIDSPRAPMTEDEILQRSRRAAAAANPSGRYDDALLCNSMPVNAAAQALRDLDKPLVDPVVLACRAIVAAVHPERMTWVLSVNSGDRDHEPVMRVAVAAYLAGQLDRQYKAAVA